jgi:hypothetical protein
MYIHMYRIKKKKKVYHKSVNKINIYVIERYIKYFFKGF